MPIETKTRQRTDLACNEDNYAFQSPDIPNVLISFCRICDNHSQLKNIPCCVLLATREGNGYGPGAP